ncbi:MAG TPA: nuclear transport factor 2 family protein [Solirubrobacterales bacterium]|nr:nuclear transport factor 2 family protein [Solirubrobacterales bacterium]
MSQENVEAVQRAFAEFEKGTFWVPEFFDPSVRIEWLDAVGTESETVGLQAMSDFMKNWLEVHDNLTLTAERIIDAGDQVVVFATWGGRGKASGVPTEWRHGQVWTMRDGKATGVMSYRDPAEALEAAGVSE